MTMMTRLVYCHIITMVIFAATACPSGAQEIIGLGGIAQGVGVSGRTGSWQLEYNEGLGEHFACSISYLNEGHLPSHHRDGNSVQLWTRTTFFDRQLSLAAGVGPYYYFDTVAARTGASYANVHGWGANLSLSAAWYREDRWFLQLRSNLIETTSGPGTVSALVGIGYQLDSPSVPGARPLFQARSENAALSELTFYLGGSIVNSFESESSPALSIEYRRRLLPYMEGSIAWLFEGDKRLTLRNGVSSQLWAVKDFFAEKLNLGIGAGPYFSVDHYQLYNGEERESVGVSAIVTMTAGYRFDRRWSLRSSWNRILTDYNRDTDVIFGGIGYRF